MKNMDNDIICLDSENEMDDAEDASSDTNFTLTASFDLKKSNMVLSVPRLELEDEDCKPVKLRRKRGPKKKLFNCQLCKKELFGMVMLNYHMKSAHRGLKVSNAVVGAAKTLLVCFYCKKQVTGKGQLTNHLIRKHGVRHNPFRHGSIFKCPVCNLTLDRLELDVHLSTVHNTSLQEMSPFWCTNCGGKFQRYGNLLLHETKCQGVKDRAPDEDVKPRPEENPVKEDKNPELESRTCSNCSRIFSSRNWLLRHEIMCESKKKRTFPCSYCPATFTNLSFVKKHEPRCLYRPNAGNQTQVQQKPCIFPEMKKKPAGIVPRGGLSHSSFVKKASCSKFTIPSEIRKKRIARRRKPPGRFSGLVKKSSDDDTRNEIENRPARIPRKCRDRPISYTGEFFNIDNETEIQRRKAQIPRKCKSREISYAIATESSSEVELPDDFIITEARPRGWVSSCTPGGVKLIYADNLCCTYCPKFLCSPYSRVMHERLHTGENPYECKHCKATFRMPKKHADHQKKCNSLIDTIWCPLCDYENKLRYKVENHCISMHKFDMRSNQFLSEDTSSDDELSSEDECLRPSIRPTDAKTSDDCRQSDSQNHAQKTIPSNPVQTSDLASSQSIPQNYDQKTVPSNHAQTFDPTSLKTIPPIHVKSFNPAFFPNIPQNHVQISNDQKTIASNHTQTFDPTSLKTIPPIHVKSFNPASFPNIPQNHVLISNDQKTIASNHTQTFDPTSLKTIPPNHVKSSNPAFPPNNSQNHVQISNNLHLDRVKTPEQVFLQQNISESHPVPTSDTRAYFQKSLHLNHDHTYGEKFLPTDNHHDAENCHKIDCNIKVEDEEKPQISDITVISDNEESDNIWSDFIIIDDD